MKCAISSDCFHSAFAGFHTWVLISYMHRSNVLGIRNLYMLNLFI